MLRTVESNVAPGLAAIQAAVYAIPPSDMSAADIFAGADPNGLRVQWIYRDTTYRIRWLIIKYGRPCNTAISGLPQVSGACRNIPRAPV